MNSRYVGYKLASAAFAFFSELHGEVTSFRLAVYDGTDIEDASHCLVAVLDTNDGDEFLKQFGELVEIVNPAPDPETQKRLAEEIGRLIVQLDDPKFAIRESASNRLKLIGASALPFLKSVEGGSYERKSRIEQLISHATIDPSEQTRNFQLTEPGFWANLRPSFSLSAAPEPFAEKPTYVLKMHKAASIPASQWNEASDMVGGLFGADWDQLKLIRMDNRFILMMGDDSRRLEETMSNLENGSDPLAEQDGGREMTRRSGQFHFRVSVARMVRAFFDEHYVAKDGFEEDYQTTLTLNIAEQDWGVCFYLPVQEIWPIITADMENRKTR